MNDRLLFEQSVDAMVYSMNIGIRYTDLDGGRHDAAARQCAVN